MYVHVKTDRLNIRPIQPEDKAFIFELLNTDTWKRFIGNRNIEDWDAAEKYIRNNLANPGYFFHVFESRETHEPIGILTLLYREHQPFPDIGFAMLPVFEGKGYAWEASRMYIEQLIQQRNPSKIIALTKAENYSSIRLIEKLGMAYEEDEIIETEVWLRYGKQIVVDTETQR